MANWFCVRTTGTFRRGNTYTSKQLGVLGRMAVKGGFLIRADDVPDRQVVKTRQRAGRKRGDVDGQAGVQAGGSAEVRDNSGA